MFLGERIVARTGFGMKKIPPKNISLMSMCKMSKGKCFSHSEFLTEIFFFAGMKQNQLFPDGHSMFERVF